MVTNEDIRINIFGDIVASSVEEVTISKNLCQHILKGDYNIVNFEAPIKCTGSKPLLKSGPSLCQPATVITWLRQCGVNAVSLSNNHMMDYGEECLVTTIACCQQNGIACFGAGDFETAYKPLIVEIKGRKIAFLALTHCEFGTLNDEWSDETIGCAWIFSPRLDFIIRELRQQVDRLFIIGHAGVECIDMPLPEWRSRYRQFIDMGCDGVIASHPHIIQPWEIYHGKPIAYSLGNFFFPKENKSLMTYDWTRSLCATIVVSDDEIKLEMLPLLFDATHIDVDDSADMLARLSHLNAILSDKTLYLDRTNQHCAKLLKSYWNLFGMGGVFVSPPLNRPICMQMFKHVARLLLRRTATTPTHVLNNIRCESHRFAISRALATKYGI